MERLYGDRRDRYPRSTSTKADTRRDLTIRADADDEGVLTELAQTLGLVPGVAKCSAEVTRSPHRESTIWTGRYTLELEAAPPADRSSVLVRIRALLPRAPGLVDWRVDRPR